MKILKPLSTFLFFSILFGACFDPPVFPNTPYIEFESLVFVEGKTLLDNDSLNLTIRFQDGDGDLGLSSNFQSDPYHNFYYFLAKDGNKEQVATIRRYSDFGDFVNPGSGQSGKLITIRTRKQPGYESLPPYIKPYSCFNYLYDTTYVSEEHKNIIDNTYNIVDTLESSINPDVYVLVDTFLIEPNPYKSNIVVQFFTKNNDGTFSEYNWRQCPQDNAPSDDFNQRFPILSEKTGPLEGNLKYAMVSSGILEVFSVKTLKLRIYIYDRAFNKSNVIETPEFTLK